MPFLSHKISVLAHYHGKPFEIPGRKTCYHLPLYLMAYDEDDMVIHAVPILEIVFCASKSKIELSLYLNCGYFAQNILVQLNGIEHPDTPCDMPTSIVNWGNSRDQAHDFTIGFDATISSCEEAIFCRPTLMTIAPILQFDDQGEPWTGPWLLLDWSVR